MASRSTKSTAALEVKVTRVTPKMAHKWLSDNEVNRNLRPKLVDAYRRDMEAGRWAMTGEPIQFSRTGRLLNGQHRLTALSESALPHLELVIATGLPDEAQSMMDQGKPRNARDALMIAHGHVKNVTIVASVLRWLVLAGPVPGSHLTPSLMRTKVTTAEALDAFDGYPEVTTAAERANQLRHTLLGSSSACGYAWVALNMVNPEACTEFFAGMADMDWSSKNDPRKAALRRMQALHRDQEVKTSIETGVMMVSVLTRAWNHWRKQEEVEALGVRSRSGLILPVTPI